MDELSKIRERALDYNRRETKKVVESYITENCPFKKGDRITYKGKPGMIETIRAEYDGNFSYDVRLDKKDGTPSLRVVSVYSCFVIRFKRRKE